MTIYRTKNGHAFDTATLRRCGDGGDADVKAWIDSLPPLEPVAPPDMSRRTEDAWSRDVLWTNLMRSELECGEKESAWEAARRVVAERDALKAERDALRESVMTVQKERDEQRARAEMAYRSEVKTREEIGEWSKRVLAMCSAMGLGNGPVSGESMSDFAGRCEAAVAVLKAELAEATKAGDKACEERDAQSREVSRLERLIDTIATVLGRRSPKESTYEAARRVVAELAEVKSRAASVTTDNMQLRAFFDEVGVMLGIKSRDGVTKGEIRVAIEALKSDVVRAGNACFDATARLQKMERELDARCGRCIR